MSNLKRETHYNKHLQGAWNQYGERSFSFRVIEYTDVSKLIEREQFFINFNRSFDPNRGYNLSPTAGRTDGYRHTDEAKKKIGNASIGRKHVLTEEDKNRLRTLRVGSKVSKETKEKMRNSHLGKKQPMSEAGKKNVSLAHRGLKLSDEHKHKIRLGVLRHFASKK